MSVSTYHAALPMTSSSRKISPWTGLHGPIQHKGQEKGYFGRNPFCVRCAHHHPEAVPPTHAEGRAHFSTRQSLPCRCLGMEGKRLVRYQNRHVGQFWQRTVLAKHELSFSFQMGQNVCRAAITVHMDRPSSRPIDDHVYRYRHTDMALESAMTKATSMMTSEFHAHCHVNGHGRGQHDHHYCLLHNLSLSHFDRSHAKVSEKGWAKTTVKNLTVRPVHSAVVPSLSVYCRNK